MTVKDIKKELANEQQEAMWLPRFLLIFGIIIIVFIMMESYFQMTKSDFSFLALAHTYGFLNSYEVVQLPNRGIWHNVGWIGTACFIMMMSYSFRKHLRFMQDVGQLRLWLDVHMFLGIVGAFLITAHSTYKLGGIVSLSYYSMVLVAGSGFIGRYIYIHIPRSISGNELEINEIRDLLAEVTLKIEKFAKGDQNILHYFERIAGPPATEDIGAISAIITMMKGDVANIGRVMQIRSEINNNPNLPNEVKKNLFWLIKRKGDLVRSSNFMAVSQRLLHYWHVFHKPFALIMFIVMFLHIAVFFIFRTHV